MAPDSVRTKGESIMFNYLYYLMSPKNWYNIEEDIKDDLRITTYRTESVISSGRSNFSDHDNDNNWNSISNKNFNEVLQLLETQAYIIIIICFLY